MEYCDLGQMMKYNCDETGYEYNKKLIINLLRKLVYENCSNQRDILINLINFKKDNSVLITENEIMQKFKSLEENINED